MPSRDEQVFGFNAADADELIQLIGSKDETHLEGRVRGGGGLQSILIKTPGGGIAAATGTGPYTFGSATCTVVGDDGVVGTATVMVRNIVNDAVAGNVIGKASKVGDIWVIDVASCS